MIINLQQYKHKKQIDHFGKIVNDFVSMLFNFFIDYIYKPTLAAMVTVKNKQVTIVY